MLKTKLNKKQKRLLLRIIIAFSAFSILFVLSRIINFESAFNGAIGSFLLCALWLAIYIFIGYDVIKKGARNLVNGQIFDENFLMIIASFGAFALGIYNLVNGKGAEGFDEAVAVLIFYQLGQFFEKMATEKSRKSISDLLDIRPDYANLLKDGEVENVFPEEVEVGSQIVIYPGEKIPLDCTVISGESTIDNKSLTGESAPVEIHPASHLLSGGINLTSEIVCIVDKHYEEGTVAKILDLVENASDKKSKAENFIEKFAKYYTPTVIILALLTAIIPSLIFKNWQVWLYRALSFLVVSCPCALVISVPMTFFVALGKTSRMRILIKGSNYLEQLAKANIFIFDKTGTVTQGKFTVTDVFPSEKREEVLKTAALAEKNSSHPIALSIVEAYAKPLDDNYILTNYAGIGVKAQKDGETILCGRRALLIENKIDLPTQASEGVFVAKNGEFLGVITVKDVIKSEANEVIAALNEENSQTMMFSGDNQKVAGEIAKECGISTFKAELLPQDKVEQVERIIKNKKPTDVVCFIGDGINDAPALMISDIGIAMGTIGSDAAIEAADVVLMKDDLHDILKAKKIANKAMRIVKQNIVFSIAVKVSILILSLFGITNMWVSIFGDVGVAILAILNALRVNND